MTNDKTSHKKFVILFFTKRKLNRKMIEIFWQGGKSLPVGYASFPTLMSPRFMGRPPVRSVFTHYFNEGWYPFVKNMSQKPIFWHPSLRIFLFGLVCFKLKLLLNWLLQDFGNFKSFIFAVHYRNRHLKLDFSIIKNFCFLEISFRISIFYFCNLSPKSPLKKNTQILHLSEL